MRIYSKPFIPYYSLKKKQGTFGVVAEKQQKTKYKKKTVAPPHLNYVLLRSPQN